MNAREGSLQGHENKIEKGAGRVKRNEEVGERPSLMKGVPGEKKQIP